MKYPDQKWPDTVGIFAQIDFINNKALADLITLATEICNVPIAIISLIKEDQLIQSNIDIDIAPGSREDAFCKYLIDQEDVMVIDDSVHDQRFADNLVKRNKCAIRFYAGSPLITGTGIHLGSICIFDQKPHPLSPHQREMLSILSRHVIRIIEHEISLKLNEQNNIELSRQKERIDVAERKLRAFFNSSAFCHILVGKDLDILDFNKATAVFIRKMYNKNIQTGNCILDYISPEYKNEFINCINRVFKGRRSNKQVLLKNEGKASVWWNISLEPVKDEYGHITSVVYNATNIDDQKKRIAEISAQNKSLLNIAHIQSHEYRRPVATILGLMELIKGDNEFMLSEYLLMMEKAVKELDEKIKRVVKYTEIIASAY